MMPPLTPGVGRELLAPDSPPSVVDALAATPRHHFVPDVRRMVSYLDRDLPVGKGRRCPRPSSVARFLSVPEPSAKRWMVVGAGTGYVAACAANLAETVIAVESDPTLAGECAFALGHVPLRDRIVLRQGLPHRTTEELFDAILVCGSLERSPRELLKMLTPEGVLVFPLRARGESKLFAYQNVPRGHLRRDLGPIDIEALPGESLQC